MCKLRYGCPAIAEAISGMTLKVVASRTNRTAVGSGPAIQSNIEMFSFFLDGRVKHGHDKWRI
jgi:hypothetical protein